MYDQILIEARKLIAANIKARRQLLGRPPEEIAKLIHISPGEYVRFEEGRGWLPMKSFLSLLHHLDLLIFVEEREGDGEWTKMMRNRWNRPGDTQ